MSDPGAILLRPDWPAPPNVHAVTTLRRGGGTGVSQAPFDDFNLGAACGDAPDAVTHNRAQLIAIAALPGSPHWLRQVHGTRVVVCAGEAPEREAAPPEADAAVTTARGSVLAILTADCLPVLFASRDGRAVAAAHAGWRGLAGGVLEATIATLQRSGSELIAWLGPAAGPHAYEIGTDVRDTFLYAQPNADRHFVPTRPGHWLVDLYGLARDRLHAAGIAEVHGGALCTISDPQRFFSHRRDGRSGRMATLIWRDG